MCRLLFNDEFLTRSLFHTPLCCLVACSSSWLINSFAGNPNLNAIATCHLTGTWIWMPLDIVDVIIGCLSCSGEGREGKAASDRICKLWNLITTQVHVNMWMRICDCECVCCKKVPQVDALLKTITAEAANRMRFLSPPLSLHVYPLFLSFSSLSTANKF